MAMTKISLICFFCYLFQTQTTSSASNASDGNHFLDSVLQVSMTSEIRGNQLDPIIMPPFYEHGQDKVGPMNVNVRAHFVNGSMSGLGKAYRPIDCGNPYYIYGNVTFNCSITFNYLQLNYQAKVKYGKVPERNGQLQVNYTRPLLSVVVTSRKGPNKPSLSGFRVLSLGQMNVDYNGFGPVNNSVKKALQGGIIGQLAVKVTNAFYGPYSYALASSVSRTPLPGGLGWF